MMIVHLILANLIYLTLVLQPLLATFLPDPSYLPWLPGIALVACLWFGNDLTTVIWAFVLGLGVDCLSIHRLGAHTTVATLLATCLRMSQGDEAPRGQIWFACYTFVVTFLWLMLSALIHGTLEGHSFNLTSRATDAAMTAAATACLVIATLIIEWSWKICLRAKTVSIVKLRNDWSMLTGN